MHLPMDSSASVPHSSSSVEKLLERVGKAAAVKDNLQLIKGIGPKIEQKLNDIGINSFQQICRMKAEDLRLVEQELKLAKGKAYKDDWVDQALSQLGD